MANVYQVVVNLAQLVSSAKWKLVICVKQRAKIDLKVNVNVYSGSEVSHSSLFSDTLLK